MYASMWSKINLNGPFIQLNAGTTACSVLWPVLYQLIIVVYLNFHQMILRNLKIPGVI